MIFGGQRPEHRRGDGASAEALRHDCRLMSQAERFARSPDFAAASGTGVDGVKRVCLDKRRWKQEARLPFMAAGTSFFDASFCLCRRLTLHGTYKEKGQTNINDAGQRQQRTEKDAKDVCGFVSAQIFAAQHNAGSCQRQQHRSQPKGHVVHLLYTPSNTSIMSVNHFSSWAKRRRSCAGVSWPLPISKKPRPL